MYTGNLHLLSHQHRMIHHQQQQQQQAIHQQGKKQHQPIRRILILSNLLKQLPITTCRIIPVPPSITSPRYGSPPV